MANTSSVLRRLAEDVDRRPSGHLARRRLCGLTTSDPIIPGRLTSPAICCMFGGKDQGVPVLTHKDLKKERLCGPL